MYIFLISANRDLLKLNDAFVRTNFKNKTPKNDNNSCLCKYIIDIRRDM